MIRRAETEADFETLRLASLSVKGPVV